MECLGLETEPDVDVNQPINQDDPHVLVDFYLLRHIVRPRIEQGLLSPTPEVDVVCVLETIERNSSWLVKSSIPIKTSRINI